MVSIDEYTDKEGNNKKSIKLGGMGDEEIVSFTSKMSSVWRGNPRKSKDGRTFVPCGIGAVYHKNINGEIQNHDVWIGLTEMQGKILDKLGITEDGKYEAYKPKGKKYVDFRKVGVPSSSPQKKSLFSYQPSSITLTDAEADAVEQFRLYRNAYPDVGLDEFTNAVTTQLTPPMTKERAKEIYDAKLK